jgi:hypothetical protein
MYFFKGPNYVRYNIAADKVDDGYPLAIADQWPGMAAAGFADGVAAAALVATSVPIITTSDLTDGFFTAIRKTAARFGCPTIDLLAVLFSESGCRATAHNANGDASGLLQFMPDTLIGLGWTQGHAAFRALSAEQQAPYVERFFLPHLAKGLTSAQRLHWAAFVPAGMTGDDDPGHVVAGKSGPFAFAYNGNPLLDLDHDGLITLGELHDWTWRQCQGQRWEEIRSRA